MAYQITDHLPILRRDIQIIAAGGEHYYTLTDTIGYAKQSLTMPRSALAILEMFDGQKSAYDLEMFLNEKYSVQISSNEIAVFAERLDNEGYLCSNAFEAQRRWIEDEYNKQTIRQSVCAGGAYPADADELHIFLRDIMSKSNANHIELGASGIIAPHIDLNIGGAAYAPAYQAISNSDADLFVIYATSHYANYDLVIPTDKDFETPLGIVRTDRELLERLRSRLPFEITRNDIAHRHEHSIELELIFLQYLFPKRDFTILPFLVTSFGNYGDAPNCMGKTKIIAESVKEIVEKSGRKAIYISSGDLGHIGRKFGDDFNAEDKLEELAREDEILTQYLAACNHNRFYSQISENCDKWKICGASPNYMLLETLQPERGITLSYDQWHEKEAKSAVSFASIVFYS